MKGTTLVLMVFSVVAGFLVLAPTQAQAARTNGYVGSFQAISDTEGNFTEILTDNTFFGNSIDVIGDLNGDDINDLVVGAFADDDGGAFSGAVFILYMNSDGTVDSSTKIGASTTEFLGQLTGTDQFGLSVSSIGDFNGDDIPDIAVGSVGDDDGGASDRGAVYLLYLNATGTIKDFDKISASSSEFAGLLDSGDQFGNAVRNIGDLDGDGIVDIAVGAISDDDAGGSARGALYILFMNATGTVKDFEKISASTTGFGYQLNANNDFFGGYGLDVLGDLDGDDVQDIIVASVGEDDGGSARGSTYIMFLNDDGTIKDYEKLSSTSTGFTGIDTNTDEFGYGAANIGDIDGDGVIDIAIGARGDDDGVTNGGAFYIFFMNTDGTFKDYRKVSGTVGGFDELTGTFGSSIKNIGDLNDDGVPELAVGAPSDADGGTGRGAVFILFLAASTINPDATGAITEGSATDTIDIVLNSEPLAQVDVTFSVTGSEATTSVGGICFTGTTTDAGSGTYAPCTLWSTPIAISVTATDDSDIEGSHSADLIMTASSSDDSYDGTTGTTTLTITDNDAAAEEEEEEEENDNDPSGSNSRSSSLPGEAGIGDDLQEEDSSLPPLPTIPPLSELTPEERAEFVVLIRQHIIVLLEKVIELLFEEVERRMAL